MVHTLKPIIALTCWVALLTCIALLLPELRRFFFPQNESQKRKSLKLVLIISLAAWVRLYFPNAAIWHDHNHGYQYFEQFFGGHISSYRSSYGLGGWAIFQAFFSFLPRSPEVVFQLNTCFATLTVIPVYILGRNLFQSERAGYFAAMILAVLPVHVRLSVTEDLYIVGGLFLAIALASLSEYLLHGNHGRYLVLTTAATVLGCQIRETLNLLPVYLIVAFFVLAKEPRKLLRTSVVRWCVVGGLAFGLPHIIFYSVFGLALVDANHPFEFEIFSSFLNWFTFGNKHFDPAVTSPVIMLFLFLGLISRRNVRASILIGGGILSFGWMAMIKTISEADEVMFHADYGILIAILAGAGAKFATDGFEGFLRNRMVANICTFCLVLSCVGWSGDFYEREYNLQHEWNFIARHHQESTQGCVVVTLTSHRDEIRELPTVSFEWIADQKMLSIGELLDLEQLEDEQCYVYYEQVNCNVADLFTALDFCAFESLPVTLDELWNCVDDFELKNPQFRQPACEQIRREVILEPIVEANFSSVPYRVDIGTRRGDPITIGFYRVRSLMK